MKKINYPTRKRPFNYGYIEKHDWEYRKALRQCRRNKKRYGAAFDNSEAYQLASAICVFMLTHNYPINKAYLYFKGKGVYKNALYEMHPNFPEDIGAENWFDEYFKVEEAAHETICKQMAELDNAHKQELIQFAIPRLQFVFDIKSLYIDIEGEENVDSWLKKTKAIYEQLREGDMTLLIENLWSLYCEDWDTIDDEMKEYYFT